MSDGAAGPGGARRGRGPRGREPSRTRAGRRDGRGVPGVRRVREGRPPAPRRRTGPYRASWGHGAWQRRARERTADAAPEPSPGRGTNRWPPWRERVRVPCGGEACVYPCGHPPGPGPLTTDLRGHASETGIGDRIAPGRGPRPTRGPRTEARCRGPSRGWGRDPIRTRGRGQRPDRPQAGGRSGRAGGRGPGPMPRAGAGSRAGALGPEPGVRDPRPGPGTASHNRDVPHRRRRAARASPGR
ncbi:hypothetical protein SAMN02745830_02682 [Streptomyces sp. Amel2xC10]|nr:hypothetical protein SAMN02745830_02682 [Streptomyces sp. Amel2xC10]